MRLATVEQRERVTAGARVLHQVRAQKAGATEDEDPEGLRRAACFRPLGSARRREIVVLRVLRVRSQRGCCGSAQNGPEEVAARSHLYPPVSSATILLRIA